MIGLTKRQLQVLNFLRAYIGTHGRSPSFQEIEDGCWLSSKQQVFERLNALEERGYIQFARVRGGYRAKRSITLNDPPVIINGEQYRFIPKSHSSDSVRRFRMAA